MSCIRICSLDDPKWEDLYEVQKDMEKGQRMQLASDVDGIYGYYDLDPLCNHKTKTWLHDDVGLQHDVKAKEV